MVFIIISIEGVLLLWFAMMSIAFSVITTSIFRVLFVYLFHAIQAIDSIVSDIPSLTTITINKKKKQINNSSVQPKQTLPVYEKA